MDDKINRLLSKEEYTQFRSYLFSAFLEIELKIFWYMVKDKGLLYEKAEIIDTRYGKTVWEKRVEVENDSIFGPQAIEDLLLFEVYEEVLPELKKKYDDKFKYL